MLALLVGAPSWVDCLGCLVGGGEKVVGWFGGKGSIADIGKSEPFSPLLPPRSGVCVRTVRKVRTYFVVQEDPDYSRTEATHWITPSTTGWSIHSKVSRVLVAFVGRKKPWAEILFEDSYSMYPYILRLSDHERIHYL